MRVKVSWNQLKQVLTASKGAKINRVNQATSISFLIYPFMNKASLELQVLAFLLTTNPNAISLDIQNFRFPQLLQLNRTRLRDLLRYLCVIVWTVWWLMEIAVSNSSVSLALQKLIPAANSLIFSLNPGLKRWRFSNPRVEPYPKSRSSSRLSF